MKAKQEAYDWSVETFGKAELGDARRVQRLIRLGARAARRPHGRISRVFSVESEREGAYDFVENEAVSTERMTEAIAGAAASASHGYPFVFAPVDGTSLKLWDGTGKKDFGRIGTHENGATGLKVINAMLLSPDGVPLGLAGQSWWKRPLRRQARPHHEKRSVQDKETGQWMATFDQLTKARDKHAASTKLWYQLDRGGDAWTILSDLDARGDWFTIRSKSNRRLFGRAYRLRQSMQKRRVSFYYRCELRSRKKHKEQTARRRRLARLSVRIATLTLALRNKTTGRLVAQRINVVMVRESGTTPRAEKPIEWVLLTNHPVATRGDVERVIFGYILRWRIEDFHKTWKSGLCKVEQTQLRSSQAVIRWATILAAVAVRAEKLKHLARQRPDEPASVELTQDELTTLQLLRKHYGPKKERPPRTLTLRIAVEWIAKLGGYTGKSSGGPPGSITIQRGLDHLRIATQAIQIARDVPNDTNG